MNRIEITIDGKAYPCQQTAGAMLRFKEITGKEVTEIDPNSISDLIKFLWCCICGACKREGINFEMSLMEFADSIGADDLTAWQKKMAEGVKDSAGKKEQKKRARKS